MPRWNRGVVIVAAMVVACAMASARADVFNMPNGQTSLETVWVGDTNNPNDSTGYGAVGYAYQMSKYEVTAGQYTAFLNAVARTDTYSLYNTSMWSGSYGCKIERSGTSGSYMYNVASDYANRPVNYISWDDAARFSNWLTNGQRTGIQDVTTTEDGAYYLNGKTSFEDLKTVTRKAGDQWFLPTVNEWYKAAYYDPNKPGGAGYWQYPTTSNTVPGRDMADVSGNNANISGNPIPIDSGKYTTVVGEFQNSDSPYGTFDQGGNVWEWNESIVNNNYRNLLGGAFNSYSEDLLSSFRISYAYPTYAPNNYGFRVARVPEPSTLALLGIGAISLVAYGWRRRRLNNTTSGTC